MNLKERGFRVGDLLLILIIIVSTTLIVKTIKREKQTNFIFNQSETISFRYFNTLKLEN